MRLTLYRGKYAVAWRGPRGIERRSLGTDDLAEAERRFNEFKQLQMVRAANPSGKLIKELWEERRTALDGKRLAENMRWSGLPIIKFFGHLEPRHVTQDICKQYADQRFAQGRKPGTIHTELSHLRMLINWAKAGGEVWRPPAPPPKDLYLTKAQAKELLNEANGHLRLFIALALCTGARNRALLELTWDRVDLSRKLINLRTEDMTNRKGRATVPINKLLYGLLSDVNDRSGYVVQWDGEPIASVKTSLKKAAQRAGVPWVSPHVFRHSAAVWMAEAGVPMEEIAQFLGHSSVEVTRKIYAKYSPDYLRNAAKALEIDNDF